MFRAGRQFFGAHEDVTASHYIFAVCGQGKLSVLANTEYAAVVTSGDGTDLFEVG
jgi:hypothetical protein